MFRYMGENLLGKRLWTWAKAFKVPIPSWFPLQRLSDEDHLKMLQRRVEDIDDEVAVIDEELVYLQKFYERECEVQQTKDTPPTSPSPPESKP
ncbi:hypothetical protein IWQ60_004495 [Tieghemiomyces parasiticus]|uniref:Uncharacterized protein n=1 Tax=Tieghemiomyces parasiticus TaxID=78921 RepID=A0A9W8ADK6_9FUNG|nr:hypothetical protein IWQ60_004495 [Tieghemiomyces parasiticus]